MELKDYQREIARLRRGDWLVMDNEPLAWWEKVQGKGFWDRVYDEEWSVRIVWMNQTFVYVSGVQERTIDKHIKDFFGVEHADETSA